MSDIQPFGTSSDSPTLDGINQKSLKVIKAFGCTVVSFDISADWSSQAGSLTLTLIEDESDGDRLSIPVIGSPYIFEVKEDDDTVIFEYIGIVDSFSRSASNTSKKYTATIASPLKILDSSKVIIDGYTGLGGSQEGATDFSGYGNIDFGTKNGSIIVDNTNGVYHWFNVSNLINAFGILENDDPLYRVIRNDSATTGPLPGTLFHGDFGFSSNSADGMPLVNLIWALHLGINHMPKVSASARQQTHGGNLLYGRHNYNVNAAFEGIPYFYDFDAIHFYNQIVGVLGPQFRVPGPTQSINEIITYLCNEANFEYFCYIDINKNSGFGDTTLREDDPNWSQVSNCSWPNLNESKFTDGGKYGGTIRIQTIDKNKFFNANRPFSNIAYNLLGLEVPDLIQTEFTNSTAVHPGKRPGQPDYGLADNSTTYMDPIDSEGLDSAGDGFTEVGTQSLADGGNFPVTTGLFDTGQMDNIKITNSNISLSASDVVTMKVVVGGYQTRIISVPRSLIRHYWGDLQLIGAATDPRTTNDTETDEFGLNEESVRKIPVVTQLLDPRDIDDFIFIDMQSIYGSLSIDNAIHKGIYAASLFEIRLAMADFDQWYNWMKTNKELKFNKIKDFFYPGCNANIAINFNAQVKATSKLNSQSGIGYENIGELLDCTNPFTKFDTTHNVYNYGFDASGNPKDAMSASGVNFPSGLFQTGVPCWLADKQLKEQLLPQMHELIKNIGDTHYGKSWYVPVPYYKTKLDLDGSNLVGNYTRSWEVNDSAYVEPSLYYEREIPQSNMFIQDGKVNPFINYDNDFVYSDTGTFFDDTYITDLSSPIDGVTQQVYNFSEYSLDQIVYTKYGNRSIKHASPEDIAEEYSFLPYAYDVNYNREIVPFTDLNGTQRKFYPSGIRSTSNTGPTGIFNRITTLVSSTLAYFGLNPTSSTTPTTAGSSKLNQTNVPNPAGWAWQTEDDLFDALDNITALSYPDNGDFCYPMLKVTTGRVFLPKMKNGKQIDQQPLNLGPLSYMIGSRKKHKGKVLEDMTTTFTQPFPACVCPRSINYAQVSTRYMYGPWMTTLGSVPFRGKIEYEQDDSLVPENFLIPLNFGDFGDFSLNQISGLTGLELAAQGRANAIDDFALFAQEQGSITIQGAPAIKRIGDSLYGIQQVTDMKISVTNSTISTSYTFKTISPRFGRNNRDLEKRLTKISNAVNKLKLI